MCKVVELTWGSNEGAAKKFDVIVASDCIVSREGYAPLVKTLVDVSHKDSLILLVLLLYIYVISGV